MWAIPDLMFRTPTAEIPVGQTTLPGIMSRLPASIASHPRPSVGVLASTHMIFGVMLIEVITSVLHRPLYIDSGIMQIHIGGVLVYRHPLLGGEVESDLEPVHLEPLVG